MNSASSGAADAVVRLYQPRARRSVHPGWSVKEMRVMTEKRQHGKIRFTM